MPAEVNEALESIESLKYLQWVFITMVVITLLLALLRLLRALSFHDRLSLIPETLANAAFELAHFGLIFVVRTVVLQCTERKDFTDTDMFRL